MRALLDMQCTWNHREPRLEANSMYEMYNQHEEDNTLQTKYMSVPECMEFVMTDADEYNCRNTREVNTGAVLANI